MKGVVVRKLKVVHSDERRSILEIMNGELAIKNMKILEVKVDSFLGGHWHTYPEVMLIYKGSAKDYYMENIDTGEREVYQLSEGDVVFRTGRIVHGGTFTKGSIVIDGASDMYLSADYNDIVPGKK